MKQTLKLALETLRNTQDYKQGRASVVEAVEDIEAVLAQPAQQEPVAWSSYEYDGIHHKPVAWMDSDGNVSDNNDHKCFPIPLYTITHPNPPQRTWVALTDEEFHDLQIENIDDPWANFKAIEAKLKEKNT